MLYNVFCLDFGQSLMNSLEKHHCCSRDDVEDFVSFANVNAVVQIDGVCRTGGDHQKSLLHLRHSYPKYLACQRNRSGSEKHVMGYR